LKLISFEPFIQPNHYKESIMKKLSLLLVLALLLVGVTTALAETPDPTYSEEWDGRGSDSEKCEYVGQEGRPESGWIHWVFSTKGKSTDAELVLGGTGSGTYIPGEPLNANVWHFYTPYFDLDGLSATIYLYGGMPGKGGGLVISDYCPVVKEKLDVSKTAVTSYKRTHKWDIAKSVDPKEFYLYTDGSGDGKATWTVDVTYKGYTDSHFKVSGDITIKNTGYIPAEITDIHDWLDLDGVDDIDVVVNCPVTLPHTLLPGETLACTYSQELEDKFEGTNWVKVTTKKDEYKASAKLVWGDPTYEVNATVKVWDNSNLLGFKDLGTVTAPENGKFTYTKEFKWADYGKDKCGNYVYKNTAKIIGDNNAVLGRADATLKVYVQCMIFKGETAWAANGNEAFQLPYNPDQGNWATYVEYAEKTTTLFAGQTIPVGSVAFSAVVDGKVTITVTMAAPWEFEEVGENLKVQDYEFAPTGNPSPGLFDHKKTCDGSPCSIEVPANNFYGVHVNVGQWIPDPSFGP
jgi:hypothetical protein